MNRTLRKQNEGTAEKRSRIYHQERLKEEASIGLDELIRLNPAVPSRTAYAELLGKSKSFVTKILNAHNFTLETLSDAYFALGYGVHFVLTPRESDELRRPQIEEHGVIESAAIPNDFAPYDVCQEVSAQPIIASAGAASETTSAITFFADAA